MAYEVTDFSNKEQSVICFRWFYKCFDTHEGFIGIYNVDNVDTLVTVIKDTLIRFNIPLSNASGLCYDGAKNMCGIKNEVFNKFFAENPKAFFTNCFRHTLSLAVVDIEKNVF